MKNQSHSTDNSLIDSFGRQVNYLRLSVTDRCDLRCVYCMSEKMTFLPRQQLLTLEETAFIAETFIELGVKKIRLTGGEPLVRENIQWLTKNLGNNPELKNFAITTNGMLLEQSAQQLADDGISRINISLDTLQVDRFKEITRIGSLKKALNGVQAANRSGFENIKLNSLIMKGRNCDEIIPLVAFKRH